MTTKRPWRAWQTDSQDSTSITDGHGTTIIENINVDLAFTIVKAINAHDALVEAIDVAIKSLTPGMPMRFTKQQKIDILSEGMTQIQDKLRAALKSAGKDVEK